MMKTIPLLLAALALTIHSAKATSGAWTGTTDGNWNVDSNWTGAFYPDTGNTATFNADVPNSTISLNTAISPVAIAFVTDTESYTFNAGGGSLTTANISIDAGVTGAVTQTFNMAVTAPHNSFYTNNSSTAILDFAGGLDTADDSGSNIVYFEGSSVVKVGGLSYSGTGTGGFSVTKRGSGKLVMSGSITVPMGYGLEGSGVLQFDSADATTTGAITFKSGIVGLGAADFTRVIGAGADQIRWSTVLGDTGFAAYGANRSVNFGGGGGAFAWTGFNMIRAGQALILGSADSTHTLDFQNPLGLADDARTILVNDGVSSTNVDGEISAVISSPTASLGSVTKTGDGTLLLSADNTYTGLTTVSAGTLLVGNSAGDGSLAGAVSVASGAALGGSGSIAGTATIDGSLRPGNSLGTLTVQDDVTWNGGNDWVFELGTAAATLGDANTGSSTQDQLNITSGGDFLMGTGSDWTIDFDGTGEAGWYKIVDWTGTTSFVAGDFTALNLASGLSGTFTVDGGTSALYLNVIPEPGTWGLLALGTLFLLSFRRRADSKQDRLSFS